MVHSLPSIFLSGFIIGISALVFFTECNEEANEESNASDRQNELPGSQILGLTAWGWQFK